MKWKCPAIATGPRTLRNDGHPARAVYGARTERLLEPGNHFLSCVLVVICSVFELVKVERIDFVYSRPAYRIALSLALCMAARVECPT
jgi:hypothetical protein